MAAESVITLSPSRNAGNTPVGFTDNAMSECGTVSMASYFALSSSSIQHTRFFREPIPGIPISLYIKNPLILFYVQVLCNPYVYQHILPKQTKTYILSTTPFPLKKITIHSTGSRGQATGAP